MDTKEYEELKSEVKKTLDHLTYEEQEKIINLVQNLIDRRDYDKYKEIIVNAEIRDVKRVWLGDGNNPKDSFFLLDGRIKMANLEIDVDMSKPFNRTTDDTVIQVSICESGIVKFYFFGLGGTFLERLM